MESLVTYKKPGIETIEESPAKLSKRQILFIVALPLLFLMAALLGISVTRLLGPFVSTNPILSTMIGFFLGIVVFIVFIPKILRMPRGKTTLHSYLNDIGVDRIRSLSRTLLIFLPCLISILVSQMVASLVYNHFFLGWVIDDFTERLFDFTRIRTCIGWSPITAVGSIFEEVVLRGVVLTMLLQVYSERKAIAGSAVAFGYVHILNLLNGFTYTNLVFVVGQIIWATIIGLLYGYMFLKTGNLYANMFLHWSANGFSNCFMLLPYITPEIHALLNIVFNIGLMSTAISISWIALVNKYWPLTTQENGKKKPPRKGEHRIHSKESQVPPGMKFGLTV
ncbi:MAG: type II CAAX endopeptidase family protein [Candidatus Thorarchaeota archaeon]